MDIKINMDKNLFPDSKLFNTIKKNNNEAEKIRKDNKQFLSNEIKSGYNVSLTIKANKEDNLKQQNNDQLNKSSVLSNIKDLGKGQIQDLVSNLEEQLRNAIAGGNIKDVSALSKKIKKLKRELELRYTEDSKNKIKKEQLNYKKQETKNRSKNTNKHEGIKIEINENAFEKSEKLINQLNKKNDSDIENKNIEKVENEVFEHESKLKVEEFKDTMSRTQALELKIIESGVRPSINPL